MTDGPHLLHTVLDAVDVRGEAEFWRELLGLAYRPGDEVPDGTDDADWLVLTGPDGRRCLAIQEVPSAAGRTAGPSPDIPSVSHLDTTVPTRQALDAAHDRVLALGGGAPVRPHRRPRRAPAGLRQPRRARLLRLRGTDVRGRRTPDAGRHLRVPADADRRARGGAVHARRRRGGGGPGDPPDLHLAAPGRRRADGHPAARRPRRRRRRHRRRGSTAGTSPTSRCSPGPAPGRRRRPPSATTTPPAGGGRSTSPSRRPRPRWSCATSSPRGRAARRDRTT